MSKDIVRVVARIVARWEKVEKVKSLLICLVEPTRKESGCIKYELQQNHQDPTDFVFIEEWESDALLDTHLASTNIDEIISKLNGSLSSAARYSPLSAGGLKVQTQELTDRLNGRVCQLSVATDN